MINKALFTSIKENYETPQYIYDELDKEFNFTLDPAADEKNHKCIKYYTENDNGLEKSWENETVFINPPYGNKLKKWVEKAYKEHIKNNITIVMLIPARTDTNYFHDFILNKSEIRFIKGRIKFVGSKNGAPFPSMIVIYRKDEKNKMKKQWYNIYFETRAKKCTFTEYLHNKEINFESMGCGDGYIVTVKLTDQELNECNKFLFKELGTVYPK